jgi:hypothetical protein
MADHRFDPSLSTISRWKSKQRQLLMASFPFVGVIVIEIIAVRGERLPLVVLLTLAVLLMFLLVLSSVRRLGRRGHKNVAWKGNGFVNASELRKSGLDQNVEYGSERRLRYWTQGRGMIGGRIEVLPLGLNLTFGFLARVAGVRGAFLIPWDFVRSIEVGKVPGILLKSSGGGFTVELTNGHRLDGQFTGSKQELLDALSLSPIANEG